MDVDRLFTNMETVCEVSAELLHRLHQATAEPDLEAVIIGNTFFTLLVSLNGLLNFAAQANISCPIFIPKERYSSRQRQL